MITSQIHGKSRICGTMMKRIQNFVPDLSHSQDTLYSPAKFILEFVKWHTPVACIVSFDYVEYALSYLTPFLKHNNRTLKYGDEVTTNIKLDQTDQRRKRKLDHNIVRNADPKTLEIKQTPQKPTEIETF